MREVAVLMAVCGCGLAVPEPNADPAALPQLWGRGGMPSMMPANTMPAPISSKWGQMVAIGLPAVGGGNCGMIDECCSMADKGCCMDQGQQCFTKWEQQCKNTNKPACTTKLKQFCTNHPMKKCEISRMVAYAYEPVTKCTPKMEEKCFTYTEKACKPTTKTYTATFNWTSEALSDGVKKTVQECKKVHTCNIIDYTITNTKNIPRWACDGLGIRYPAESYEVPYTTYRTVYQQQCYQQNVQTCNKKTQKCGMTTNNVCQQIPIRVPVQSTRIVTPPPKYGRNCIIVYDEVDTVHNAKRCIMGAKKDCFKYEVRNQTVERQAQSAPKEFLSGDCVLEETEKEHCVMLPTQLDCEKTNKSHGVIINHQVCNKIEKEKYCNLRPFSSCQSNPGQECRMVPRQVCQQTCKKSNYCDHCSQFAVSGGFSQCPTKTCPNFYSPAANCPRNGSCY